MNLEDEGNVAAIRSRPYERNVMTPDRNPWLESLIRPNLRPYSKRAPVALESVGRLLERFGNPHRRLRVIHIAGSKGKGATALMVEAMLQAMGIFTGTFTSPHLQRWTERFRIGGREITRGELDEAQNALRPHVDALTRAHPDDPPSFFDVLTAMALWLFERRGVDVAIVETGIGGRYDATNIVRPEVVCITNVELEHTDKLGTDLAEIASHKAGILKPNTAAVLGAFDEAAEKVIASKVQESGCSASWLGKNFAIRCGSENGAEKLAYRSGNLEIEFSLAHPGRHMSQNAALAIACVERLKDVDPAQFDNAASALAAVSLPGRTEVLRSAPWWVVDAAHTRRSVAALAEVLDALPVNDRHFIVSLSGEKSAELLAPLLDAATSIIATSPEPMRSAPVDKLASELSTRYPGKQIHTEPDVARAIGYAASRMGSSSLLCATGSTYMAGAARQCLLSMAGEPSFEPSPKRSSAATSTQASENAAPSSTKLPA